MPLFQISFAKNISFCGGVRWAIQEVFKLREKTDQEIYVFGELIHNKQFNDSLREKGIFIANNLDECKDKIVIIRSHGVAPETEKKLRELSFKLVDLTCPKVKKIQQLAEAYSKKNYQVLICGNPKHPEVIGIRGYTNNSLVIENEEQANNLKFNEKSILISQSTFSNHKFLRITDILKSKNPRIKIENTLCLSTQTRQNEVAKMAAENDLLLIVGGKHSSNTKKLYETAQKVGFAKVLHIETVQELKDENFSGFKTIAIASGASTPHWIIDDIFNFLNKL